MPHQNTSSSTATAQNAASDPVIPSDREVRDTAEPKTYAAPDASNASVAPPAAGETTDFMAEGDALDDAAVQQGSERADRPNAKAESGQGPKTLAANRERLKGQ